MDPSPQPEYVETITSEENTVGTAASGATAQTPVLSKSAQKRAARAEKVAAQKLERRAREKEQKKEKKALKAAKRAAGELDEEEEERKKKKPRLGPRFGGRVVVDLGFDDKMTDKEIKSLCSQLAYTYSTNRRANFPFSLIYSSLNGQTLHKLEGMGDAAYKRWSHAEWWTEGYQKLWVVPEPSKGQEPASEGTTSPTNAFDKNTFVYLTADSEEELEELKPHETYIIGGLCDHNRYKNICLNKAKQDGIRTARLPIGRYLSLSTRKVLTVNQAFEILLQWVETRNWEHAFYAVIPKRKFQNGGKDKQESPETIIQEEDIQQEEGSPVEQEASTHCAHFLVPGDLLPDDTNGHEKTPTSS